MSPEDKAKIFDHIQTSIIPMSENKMKKLIKSSIRTAEINASKKIKEIKRLEPILEEKIQTLNKILQEVTQKIGDLEDFNSRLVELENNQNQIEEERLLDALVKRLQEG